MIIHCDGLCEPNPGKATWAFVILDHGITTYAEHGYLGDGSTNIVAEYTAVQKAAEYAQKRGLDGIEIYTDLELVVKQVSGEWGCNQDRTREARDLVRSLIKSINATVKWVPGSENQADEWTRIAFEEATGIRPRPRPTKRKSA